jgi:hypothetical protein
MTVKLRPGTHYARAAQGLAIAHRNTSFVLRGPAALYDLIDANVDQLMTGTDAAAMALTVGDPAAAPVFEQIIDALRERDVVIDLDLLGAPPAEDEAQRFAATVAYCESMCPDPYRSFAALRAARVAVSGGGPTVAPLLRSLRDAGVPVVPAGDRPDLTVVVVDGEGAGSGSLDDLDDLDDLGNLGTAGTVGSGQPGEPGEVLTVISGPSSAVVGPVTRAVDEWTPALARRVARWVALDQMLAAPRPLSAVLAGSLAVRAVLDHLLGITGPATATVVHGRLLETSEVPVPATAVTPDAAGEANPAAIVSISPDQPAGAVLALTTSMTARFSGPVRRGTDDDLPQLPLSLATAEGVEGGGPVVGWGADRGAAGLDAVLRATRRWTAGSPPRRPWTPPSPAVAVAGLTGERAELDGLLRLLGSELSAAPGRQLSWDGVPASRPRALWSVLEEYFDRRVRLTAHAGPAPWVLVTARDDAGRTGTQWGFSVAAAAFCALGELLLQSQLPGADPDPVGTHALAWAPEHSVVAGLSAGRAAGWTWRTAWSGSDEVVGELPVRTGWIWRS